MNKSPKKEKGLKPAHREKKRYVVVEAIGGEFSLVDIKKAVEEALFEYLGVKGMSKVGLLWLKDYKENKALFRISAKTLDDVRSGLLFVKKIGGISARIDCKYVSGTIKSARENI